MSVEDIVNDTFKQTILDYCSPYVNEPKFKEFVAQMINNICETDVKTLPKPSKWFIKANGEFKCDAENCDWHSENAKIPLWHYYMWRNLPCPKCGANIFTDIDWYNMLALNRLARNPILRFLNCILKSRTKDDDKLYVEMNGTGMMDFKDKDGKSHLKITQNDDSLNVNITK